MRLAEAVEGCGERGLGGGWFGRGFALGCGFGLLGFCELLASKAMKPIRIPAATMNSTVSVPMPAKLFETAELELSRSPVST